MEQHGETEEHKDPSAESVIARQWIIGQPDHRYPLTGAIQQVDTFSEPDVQVIARTEQELTLSVPLKSDEAIWGFGQRFDHFNLRGQTIEIWATDGWNRTDTSYFAVPFYISSTGYGLFINHPGRITLDIGHTDTDRLTITIPDGDVELLQFEGTPAEISQDYTALVGRPRYAPSWIYRPWMSRNSYLGAYEVNRMLRRMYALDMPVGVVVLEAWAEELHNFRFAERRYPRPISWLRDLRNRDVRVVCWITPSIWTNSRLYREAKEKGFLVRNEDGSEHVVRWLEDGRLVDFRIPEARTWWRDNLRPLADMGVSGLKTDGGEHMPDPDFHNQHPFYYQQASLEAFSSQQTDGVTFARSAGPMNANLGLFWAGDQRAEWSRLAGVVRAGLSAALSGFPLWGHDIGGYSGIPPKSLYIRWLQFGAFSPLMHFHGEEAREPWHYDEETLDIARFYFAVRERLVPHLIRWGQDALATGTPLIRPLIWAYPDDHVTHTIDDQFMLGPDLLVAPITDRTAQRAIYLPDGEWVNAWTETVHEGPAWIEQAAALHEIPLFVRRDAYATYQDLLDGAPQAAEPDIAIERVGAVNERGIQPRLLYYTGTPVAVSFRATNRTSHTVPLGVRLATPATIDVQPRQILRFRLPPEASQEISFMVQPTENATAGTYPLTLEARSIDGDIPTEDANLVLSPSWRVLGLFEGGVESGIHIDPRQIDWDAEHTDRHGKPISWQNVPAEAMREDGTIDLASVVGGDGFSTSYLHTRIHSPWPKRVFFRAGSGDAMTVWVNGREVFHLPAHRNPERDEDRIEAVLVGGVNTIVIRNSRDLAEHHVYFRLLQ